MAGIGALRWKNDSLIPICSDGKLIEPLDVLHLLFPNKGPTLVGENVCFVPRPFQFPLLNDLLPAGGGLFTPDDLVDAIVALVLLCIIFTVGLVVVKYTWEYLDPQFSSITPRHKQWYVVANMSKAFFLFCMSVSSRYWIGGYRGYLYDNFHLTELKRCMMLYVATDTVALYMVPKLPFSTTLHHVSTTLISFIVCSVNLKVKGWSGLLGFCKMACIYGQLSTIPFLVNAYLALRVVYPRAGWVRVLCHISLLTYLLCVTLNWSVHILWLLGYWTPDRDFSIFTLLYIGMLSFLVHDDIVLIRWLIKQGSPMAADQKTQ